MSSPILTQLVALKDSIISAFDAIKTSIQNKDIVVSGDVTTYPSLIASISQAEVSLTRRVTWFDAENSISTTAQNLRTIAPNIASDASSYFEATGVDNRIRVKRTCWVFASVASSVKTYVLNSATNCAKLNLNLYRNGETLTMCSIMPYYSKMLVMGSSLVKLNPGDELDVKCGYTYGTSTASGSYLVCYRVYLYTL